MNPTSESMLQHFDPKGPQQQASIIPINYYIKERIGEGVFHLFVFDLASF